MAQNVCFQHTVGNNSTTFLNTCIIHVIQYKVIALVFIYFFFIPFPLHFLFIFLFLLSIPSIGHPLFFRSKVAATDRATIGGPSRADGSAGGGIPSCDFVLLTDCRTDEFVVSGRPSDERRLCFMWGYHYRWPAAPLSCFHQKRAHLPTAPHKGTTCGAVG